MALITGKTAMYIVHHIPVEATSKHFW